MSDHDLTPRLKCNVELELIGLSVRTLDKWAADALRAVADRLESSEYKDGFTDVRDAAGKTIGTIYVDYSEGNVG